MTSICLHGGPLWLMFNLALSSSYKSGQLLGPHLGCYGYKSTKEKYVARGDCCMRKYLSSIYVEKSTCRFVIKLETPLGEGMFLTYDGIPINHRRAIKCFKQDCKLISNSNKASEEYLIRLALLFMTFQQGIPPQSSIEDIWPPMVWNLMMFISCSNLTQMKQMMNHSLYISSSSISRAIPFPIANPKFQVRMVFIWHKWEVYIPCLLHDFLERYDSSIFPY